MIQYGISECKELIEYGIDKIDSKDSVPFNVKDLAYLYKSIEQLRKFFHQPAHFENKKMLSHFMGNRDQGMYSVLDHIYFEIFERVLTEEMQELLNSEEINPSILPDYYKILEENK